MMYALLGAAQARDETVVGLLGEPSYYGRFGFVAATGVGIAARIRRGGAISRSSSWPADRPARSGTQRRSTRWVSPPVDLSTV